MTVDARDGLVIAALVVACATDLTSRKVPNALTTPFVLAGLAINAFLGDLRGALIGLAVAFAIHFVLWMLQVQKAGDAKLMMGIGATCGTALMLETTLCKYLVFLPVGFLILAVRGRLPNLVASIRWLWSKARGIPVGERPEPTYVAYAPAIAAGWALARFTHFFDLG